MDTGEREWGAHRDTEVVSTVSAVRPKILFHNRKSVNFPAKQAAIRPLVPLCLLALRGVRSLSSVCSLSSMPPQSAAIVNPKRVRLLSKAKLPAGGTGSARTSPLSLSPAALHHHRRRHQGGSSTGWAATSGCKTTGRCCTQQSWQRPTRSRSLSCFASLRLPPAHPPRARDRRSASTASCSRGCARSPRNWRRSACPSACCMAARLPSCSPSSAPSTRSPWSWQITRPSASRAAGRRR